MHSEYFRAIYSHRDAASFLRSLFAGELAEGGKRSSLRAWAQILEVNPGFLSQVLSSKRRLSDAKAMKIAELLGMGTRESRYFRLLVRRDTARSDSLRHAIEGELDDLRRVFESEALDAETFAAIHDWYHVPILEMLDLDGLEHTPLAFAMRLGVSPLEAEVALERLTRLGLIERRPDGRLGRTQENFRFRSPHRNEAFGRYHGQMMALAVRAMDKSPMDERLVMSQTFCISKTQMEEARLMTREYIEKMAGLFNVAPAKEDTYQLNVQFFRLTDGQSKAMVPAVT